MIFLRYYWTIWCESKVVCYIGMYTKIIHPTATKTVIPECEIAANCVVAERYIRYTCDSGMWHYGITVIAHVVVRCKSC
jgi:hypothetical protein